MAVSTSENASEVRQSPSDENKGSCNDKKVTPFSIDDILSKSESFRPQSQCLGRNDKARRINTTSEIQKFICPENILYNSHSWNQQSYAKWLEHLNRLCAATALQPFWLSDCGTGINYFNQFDTTTRSNSEYIDAVKSKYKLTKRCDRVVRSRRRNSSEYLNVTKERRITSPKQSKVLNAKLSFEAGSSLRKHCENGDVDLNRNLPNTGDGDRVGKKDFKTTAEHLEKLNSPLSALEKLTCITFKGMEEKQHELHAVASGKEARTKRRKCRTAFTAFQLSVLERRFSCHKYLTPSDRDQIAHVLGLSAPQVITWFQNRRAKLKRDLEEMRNDLKTVKNWKETKQEKRTLSISVSSEEQMEMENPL